MTRTQPIDESLNLELAVDGCMWPRLSERSSTGDVDRIKRRHDCYEKVSADQQQAWHDLLATHVEQLRAWTEINPSTFADKHALVSAEIARLERRDSDAMRLYEQAINLARENGFVQNEALAHELAARFYAERGVETVAQAYLRSARNCYDRWGAHGKVRQLDARYPRLREEQTRSALTATVGTPVAATILRSSSAPSIRSSCAPCRAITSLHR